MANLIDEEHAGLVIGGDEKKPAKPKTKAAPKTNEAKERATKNLVNKNVDINEIFGESAKVKSGKVVKEDKVSKRTTRTRAATKPAAKPQTASASFNQDEDEALEEQYQRQSGVQPPDFG